MTTFPAWLVARDTNCCELIVHAQPGAATSEVVGEHGDALKIRLHARAVEGAANAALIAFVAERLGIARRDVELLRGDTSRRKTLRLHVPIATAHASLAP
jgi:hypothetical protein